MKVNDKSTTSTAGAKINSAKAGKSDAAKALHKDGNTLGALGTKDVRGNSKVDVSERAQMMQKARDIASEPSVDEAKVARLQKMIDEGSYNVDADKIADRLVDEHMLIPD